MAAEVASGDDDVFATAILPSQAVLDDLAWSKRLPLDELVQPDLAFVLGVWQAKRLGRELPARAAFDVADLRPAISHVMILDVRNGPRDFIFRLAGGETVHIHQRELTGCSIADIGDKSWQQMMRGEFDELVDTRQPQFARLRYNTLSGIPRDYHELRLPLADDGATVNKIMVMQDFTIGLLRGAATISGSRAAAI